MHLYAEAFNEFLNTITATVRLVSYDKIDTAAKYQKLCCASKTVALIPALERFCERVNSFFPVSLQTVEQLALAIVCCIAATLSK